MSPFAFQSGLKKILFRFVIVGAGIVNSAVISDGYCDPDTNRQLFERLTSTLPNSQAAQMLSVGRRPQFLSTDEVQILLNFEKSNKYALGSSRRDIKGHRKLDSPWKTSYLHTNSKAMEDNKVSSIIKRLIEAALIVEKEQKWKLIRDDESIHNIGIRVIELHTVLESGGLSDVYHHDNGSIITIDVMLSIPEIDFEGGKFQTIELNEAISSNGSNPTSSSSSYMKDHVFNQGDVLFFPSHKYHNVSPVTSGRRQVLVIELWYGHNKICPHRCMYHTRDECSYTLVQNYIENIMNIQYSNIDPW